MVYFEPHPSIFDSSELRMSTKTLPTYKPIKESMHNEIISFLNQEDEIITQFVFKNIDDHISLSLCNASFCLGG